MSAANLMICLNYNIFPVPLIVQLTVYFLSRFEDHTRPVLDLTYLDYKHTVVSMDQQQTIVRI